MSEVQSKTTEFDNMFRDIFDDESFKQFIGEQRRMQRKFMEQIKELQAAIERGKLEGRTELIPFDKPGIKGFVFRGVFGMPRSLGEDEKPQLGENKTENNENLEVPKTDKGLRKPFVDTFTDKDQFVALVELPGAEEQDIKVETGDNLIQVGAINFRKTKIRVPADADISKMTKTYKNSVLEIRIPLDTGSVNSGEIKFGVA